MTEKEIVLLVSKAIRENPGMHPQSILNMYWFYLMNLTETNLYSVSPIEVQRTFV